MLAARENPQTVGMFFSDNWGAPSEEYTEQKPLKCSQGVIDWAFAEVVGSWVMS